MIKKERKYEDKGGTLGGGGKRNRENKCKGEIKKISRSRKKKEEKKLW